MDELIEFIEKDIYNRIDILQILDQRFDMTIHISMVNCFKTLHIDDKYIGGVAENDKTILYFNSEYNIRDWFIKHNIHFNKIDICRAILEFIWKIEKN